MKTAASHFQTVFSAIEATGFLLASDAKLPSACSLITGQPLVGSWWSHPQAQIIFAVNERLDDNKDILIAKLISGKVTFVHRQLWSHLLSIGKERAPWQFEKVPREVRTLLNQIESAGTLTTADVLKPIKMTMKLGDAARALEKKLLVVSTQFHSDSGAHEKRLETWDHWARRLKFIPDSITPASAKKNLEERVAVLNLEFNAKAKLPWQ